MLTHWRADKLALGWTTVLACRRDNKLAAGRMAVLARWRDDELAVGRTMELTRLGDNGADGRVDDGASALLAVPFSLVQRRVGGGANGGVCLLAQRQVGGGSDDGACLWRNDRLVSE